MISKWIKSCYTSKSSMTPWLLLSLFADIPFSGTPPPAYVYDGVRGEDQRMQPDVASYTDDSLSSPRLHLKGRSIRETSGSLESAKSVRDIDIQRTSICFHDIISQMFLSLKSCFFVWFFFLSLGLHEILLPCRLLANFLHIFFFNRLYWMFKYTCSMYN